MLSVAAPSASYSTEKMSPIDVGEGSSTVNVSLNHLSECGAINLLSQNAHFNK
jgi:hypothetical protein